MTAVLSLGSTCEPAFAMNEYFKGKRSYSVFDWMVTPFRSMLAILHDDGEQLATDFRIIGHGNSLLCERYGVLYHHEFQRTMRSEITFSQQQIKDTRDKLMHKHREMMRVARENPVVFVRYGIGTDAPGDRHAIGELTHYDLEELISTLRRKLNHNEFSIAFAERHRDDLQLHEAVPETPHLWQVRRFPYTQTPETPPQSGDPEFWAAVFRSFDLTPDDTLAGGLAADKP